MSSTEHGHLRAFKGDLVIVVFSLLGGSLQRVDIDFVCACASNLGAGSLPSLLG